MIWPGVGVAFVQRKAHKAGAQSCLARILLHPEVKPLGPVLISSGKGWLTNVCRDGGVHVIEERFPSSRSLIGRLVKNDLFSRRVKARLLASGYRPAIVQANDHGEGLLALKIAGAMAAKSAIILRSWWMTKNDYFKYQCDKFDLVFAVGDDLLRRVKTWDPQRRAIELIYDGVYPTEVGRPKRKASAFPRKVLVIGSPMEAKGWEDVVDALGILSQETDIPIESLDFTGDKPHHFGSELKVGGATMAKLNFLNWVEDFRDLAIQYDLVINPSRGESFGMAAVEVLAAGVPLLSSRTGVLGQIIKQERLLFEPNDPKSLAMLLKDAISNWKSLEPGILAAQQMILRNFTIDHCVERLLEGYARLMMPA